MAIDMNFIFETLCRVHNEILIPKIGLELLKRIDTTHEIDDVVYALHKDSNSFIFKIDIDILHRGNDSICRQEFLTIYRSTDDNEIKIVVYPLLKYDGIVLLEIFNEILLNCINDVNGE